MKRIYITDEAYQALVGYTLLVNRTTKGMSFVASSLILSAIAQKTNIPVDQWTNRPMTKRLVDQWSKSPVDQNPISLVDQQTKRPVVQWTKRLVGQRSKGIKVESLSITDGWSGMRGSLEV
jgi:hypothetical protein